MQLLTPQAVMSACPNLDWTLSDYIERHWYVNHAAGSLAKPPVMMKPFGLPKEPQQCHLDKLIMSAAGYWPSENAEATESCMSLLAQEERPPLLTSHIKGFQNIMASYAMDNLGALK